MDPSRNPPSSEVEDDIIDLTDIVEKGTVPPEPGDTGGGDNALESLMADLLTGSDEAPPTEEEDFDLDALLKASGLNDEGGTAETNTAAPSPAGAGSAVASPDSSLDSSDMGDVDALLRDLVAPEQPASPTAEAPPAASHADFGELLQSSMDREAAPQQAAAPAGGAGAESEVDVEDLDSLLASIMDPETEAAPPQASPAPFAAPAPDLGDLEGLDDLLGEPQPDAVQAASPSAGPAPKSSGQASSPAPGAKRPAAAKAPVAEPKADDLDALFGEAPASAHAPASAPVPDTSARAGEDEDPLSGLDELLAKSESTPSAAGAPEEVDLGDPLLVGEADLPAPDGDARQHRASAVSANIAAMRQKMADAAAGGDASAFDALRKCVDDLAAEVRDLAESYASGLAAAEARISALEAELAAGGPPTAMSEDMARLEQRLETLENSGEKAAAEAAARVIREEIAALLAEMGAEA